MIDLAAVADALDRGELVKARLAYEGGPEGDAPMFIIGIDGERCRVVRPWHNEPMIILAECLEAMKT